MHFVENGSWEHTQTPPVYRVYARVESCCGEWIIQRVSKALMKQKWVHSWVKFNGFKHSHYFFVGNVILVTFASPWKAPVQNGTPYVSLSQGSKSFNTYSYWRSVTWTGITNVSTRQLVFKPNAVYCYIPYFTALCLALSVPSSYTGKT